MSETLIHTAVLNCDLKQLKCLLENGHDVNILDSKKNTPLHTAAYRISNKLRAQIEKQGEKTCFCSDNTKSDIKIVKLLIQHGADVNAKNLHNETPLHRAVAYNFPRIQKPDRKRLQSMLKGHTRDDFSSAPLVFQKSDMDLCVNFEIIKILIEHGADVNAKDELLGTPLEYSIWHANPIEIAKLLSKIDPNVNETNMHCGTVLNCAIKKHQILKLLIDLGADNLMIDNYNMTPLDTAVLSSDRVAVRILLRKIDFNLSRDNKRYERSDYTKETYLRHLVRMKSANLLRVEDTEYAYWKSQYDSIQFCEFHRGFDWTELEEDCRLEVKQMNRERICETRSVSYLNILTKPLHMIALFINCRDVQEEIQKADLDAKFPEYADILLNRIEDATEFAETLRNCYNFLQMCFGLMPHVVLDEIVHYLSDDDLKKLNACL